MNQRIFLFFGKQWHLRWRDVRENFKSQNLDKPMHEYQLLASSDAKERKVLKVTVYLVIGNVLQISIIGLSNNANEISNID